MLFDKNKLGMYKHENIGSYMCFDILLIYFLITPFCPVILAIPGERRKSQSHHFFLNNQQGNLPKTSEEILESVLGPGLKIIKSSLSATWWHLHTISRCVSVSSIKEHDSQKSSAAPRLAWDASDTKADLGTESWAAEVGIGGKFLKDRRGKDIKCALCGSLRM